MEPRKATTPTMTLPEARAAIAAFLDRPDINIEQDYVHLHMNAEAQDAILGEYIGRMRVRVYVAGGYLVWLASRSVGFGGDRDLAGAGLVVDDNLYCRRVGGPSGPFLRNPEVA